MGRDKFYLAGHRQFNSMRYTSPWTSHRRTVSPTMTNLKRASRRKDSSRRHRRQRSESAATRILDDHPGTLPDPHERKAWQPAPCSTTAAGGVHAHPRHSHCSAPSLRKRIAHDYANQFFEEEKEKEERKEEEQEHRWNQKRKQPRKRRSHAQGLQHNRSLPWPTPRQNSQKSIAPEPVRFNSKTTWSFPDFQFQFHFLETQVLVRVKGGGGGNVTFAFDLELMFLWPSRFTDLSLRGQFLHDQL